MRQIYISKSQGADVVHSPESGLSGYAGVNGQSYQTFDWDLLKTKTREVLWLARQLSIWIILGSAHPLTRRHKPHNCLYIINREGRLVDRYDKMFCSGDRSERTGDLAHYTPGNRFSVFRVKGIRCGALICHDYRYPELYRDYKRRHVRLIFHSYHAGNISQRHMRRMQSQVGRKFHKLNWGSTYPEITMPAAMVAAAASNHIWISCSNTSARESSWASFFVRADGVVIGRLRRNIAGILISMVDTEAPLYDSSEDWRENALKGIFHSGRLVQDGRTDERRKL